MKNLVNCWKPKLNKNNMAISSQAWRVISLKVQRLSCNGSRTQVSSKRKTPIKLGDDIVRYSKKLEINKMEYGQSMMMGIFGVELLNQGQGISVDDMVTGQ